MNNDEFVTVAKVVKPQGRVGEVLVELFTDYPEKFEERRTLYAWLPRGERRELKLEEFWPHKGTLVLKFAGVDSIEDAEALKGAEIQIAKSDRTKLEEGAVYVSDLVGCAVIVGGREIGKVADVDFGAGEAPLLVVRETSPLTPKTGVNGAPSSGNPKEYLVPFAGEFVKSQDLKAKRIEMQLPEGLLEVDAPLSSDEKSAQKRGDEGKE